MRDAAAAGPGTVRQLAARAQVGMRCAAYTAHRLVAAGHLQVLDARRPTVLALGDGVPQHRQRRTAHDAALDQLDALLWGRR